MRMKYLPDGLKRALRPLPQWAAIGADPVHDPVRVWLRAGGGRFDVSENHVVAALNPLTLALGLDVPLQRAIEQDHEPSLIFLEDNSGRCLASLYLRYDRTLRLGNAELALFKIQGHQQRCVRWPYRAWNGWLQNRAARKNTDTANFAMTRDSQQQIMIFYILPRPVVLVSVEHAEHANIFPMDLIGPVSSERFTLALRSTSRSIDTMKSCRRLALSDVAAQHVRLAHALGRHHRQAPMDWSALPFAIERSPHFSLPIPSIALRIREFEIMDFSVVGSHTLFVCRQQFERRLRDGVPLCHTSGIYQHFRSRQRQPLTSAYQCPPRQSASDPNQ
jgi:flavin reductase (DIM6/NTAB) family NADH-FMN oxidoreductase RutF